MTDIKVGDRVKICPEEGTEFHEVFGVGKDHLDKSFFTVIDIDTEDEEFPYYVEGVNDGGHHIDFWLERKEVVTAFDMSKGILENNV